MVCTYHELMELPNIPGRVGNKKLTIRYNKVFICSVDVSLLSLLHSYVSLIFFLTPIWIFQNVARMVARLKRRVVAIPVNVSGRATGDRLMEHIVMVSILLNTRNPLTPTVEWVRNNALFVVLIVVCLEVDFCAVCTFSAF